MFKRLAAGLLSVVAGCSGQLPEPVPSFPQPILRAVQEPRLEDVVRATFARPDVRDIVRSQYRLAQSTGLEWGGILLETESGTHYIPVPNDFDKDLDRLYRWHLAKDPYAKQVIDGRLLTSEIHHKKCRGMPPVGFALPEFTQLKNNIAHLPFVDVQQAVPTLLAYRDLVQRYHYTECPDILTNLLLATRGKIRARAHAHPCWHEDSVQSSPTDRDISLSEDMLLFVPRDGYLNVFTIKQGKEDYILQIPLFKEVWER